MIEEIIDKISEHWTVQETEEVRTKYGYNIKPEKFYVVMNMAYSDYEDIS